MGPLPLTLNGMMKSAVPRARRKLGVQEGLGGEERPGTGLEVRLSCARDGSASFGGRPCRADFTVINAALRRRPAQPGRNPARGGRCGLRWWYESQGQAWHRLGRESREVGPNQAGASTFSR